MEAKHEYVLRVAEEMEDTNSILNQAFQEQRLLARISELQRSQDMINSDYYWRRLENLCNEFLQVKNNSHAKTIR